ncbi:tetratricopeptide repeat protein [Nocardia sp. NPDC058058]|uniref:tetratricopeptide repeat protein n=1 Tax=Nocardia sp. NPDC058058 TaxID=3346317 RepID=UPI0036DD088A
MAPSEEDLHALRAQARRLPESDGKDAALEQILRHAEAGDHRMLAFATRMDLIDAYSAGMQPSKLFVPFARCLADYDRNPAEYPEWAGRRLRWFFKFAVQGMVNFPEVSKDRALAALDQMERRYKSEGQSPHAVYAHRHRVALHLGDPTAAEDWYQRWCTSPYDHNSDCAGCDPSQKVAYLAGIGRDDEAIEVATPVLAGELTCREQPQTILSELMLPYLRTGQWEQARNAHRRAYRILRTRPQDLSAMAQHLEFCALSGNQARGLEILERHLSWLDRAPNPLAAMRFAGSAALLLRTVAEAGHADTMIRRPAHADRPATELTAGVLFEEMRGHALAIAERFDRRNGTDRQTASVRELLDQKPVADQLPLSIPVRPGPVLDPPAVLEVPKLPVLELVERLESAQDAQALAAMGPLVRQLEDHDPGDPVLAGRIAALLSSHAANSGEDARSEALLRQAVELFTTARESERRTVAVSRLGAKLCGRGDLSEGLALLRAAYADLDRVASTNHRALVVLRLISGLGDAVGNGDDAVALDEIPVLLEQSREIAAASDDPVLIGDIAYEQMEFEDLRHRHEEALEAGARALAAYRVSGPPLMRALVASRMAEVHAGRGDYDAGLVLVEEALAEASPEIPAGARAHLHKLRGQLLRQVDRDAEAVGELLAALTLSDDPDEIPATKWALAEAYRKTGQLIDAADAAEEAIAGLEERGYLHAVNSCRFLLADLHRELREPEAALAVYDEIIEFHSGTDDHAALGYTLALAADLLDGLDRDAQAADYYRRAAEAAELADDPLRVSYTRYCAALSLHWSGATQDALDALETAEQALAALAATDPNPEVLQWHNARLDHNAARILRGAGRLDEAVAKSTTAAAHFRSIGQPVQAARVDLGHARTLVELQQPAEAIRLLDATLTEITDDETLRTALLEALAHARAHL